jgi:low affinity Fe/Cu permease
VIGDKMTQRLTDLARWLTRFGAWLYEARMLCIVVFVVPAAAFVTSFEIFSVWEARLRIAGLFLQLFGIAVVVWGLSETGRLFGKRNPAQYTLAWFGRFPRFNVERRIIVGSGVTIQGAAMVAAVGAVSIRANMTLEERVAALEATQKHLDEKMVEIQARYEQQIHTMRNELQSERGERALQNERTQKRLEEVAAGSLHLEWAGVCWLLLGLVLATAPTEIIRFFTYLASHRL